MISLDDIQKLSRAWRNRNFPTTGKDDYEQFIGLVEEVGEIGHALLKSAQKIRGNEDLQKKEMDAIGDAVIYLCGYCDRRELDLRACVDLAWKEVSQRDWIKWPQTGRPPIEAAPPNYEVRPPEPGVLESYTTEQVEEAGGLTHREALRAKRPSLGGDAA